MWLIVTISAALLVVGALVGLWVMARTAKVPENLGVREGRLAPCPQSPNCVSSQAEEASHRVEPLKFEVTAGQAWEAAMAATASLDRTRIVEDTGRYLHAEVRSRVFGFVDDLELLMDAEAKVIHVRSASRSGYSDLGVNRSRIQTLRGKFSQALGG